MFMLSKEELQKLGAENTTREIRQQPELWHETFDRYQETVADLDRLFTDSETTCWRATDPRHFYRGRNLSICGGYTNSVSY